VDKLRSYEAQLLAFVESKHPEILKEIDEKKVISPELDKKLRAVLTEFDTVYTAE
jgi:F-type H+-transporting ATPase subunit alpha